MVRLKPLMAGLGLLALAACEAPQKGAVRNDAAFERELRAYLLEHPEVIHQAAGEEGG